MILECDFIIPTLISVIYGGMQKYYFKEAQGQLKHFCNQ